jgi:hypothetical protein
MNHDEINGCIVLFYGQSSLPAGYDIATAGGLFSPWLPDLKAKYGNTDLVLLQKTLYGHGKRLRLFPNLSGFLR